MTQLNQTHDPAARSWVESANQDGGDFPIQNLPYGVFSTDGDGKRAGVAIGAMILAPVTASAAPAPGINSSMLSSHGKPIMLRI